MISKHYYLHTLLRVLSSGAGNAVASLGQDKAAAGRMGLRQLIHSSAKREKEA